MTRVVINSCYGGFSLSAAGETAYAARKGKQAFFYVEDRESAKKPGDREHIRVSETIAQAAFMFTTLTEDIGERVSHDTIWPGGQTHQAYVNGRELERDDPDLVAIVEADTAAVSGSFADLRVVDVPADVNWKIEEYDGYEHVAEVHRTWA